MTPRNLRAVRVEVDSQEPLIGGRRYDYADSFEIRLPGVDERSAEELTRQVMAQAPTAVRQIISTVHRHVLRLRLGPASDPNHLFGWRIAISEPQVLHLEATSPLLGSGAIVVRRLDQGLVRFTTYLFFERQLSASALWAVVGPLHRRVAPYLMEHGATSSSQVPRVATAGRP